MRLLIAAAAFALAACQPPATKQASSAPAASASADGPSCDKAAATLTMRGPDGAILLTQAYNADQVMTLKGKKTSAELTAALAEWIDPTKASPNNSKDLPAWPKGQANPPGEFPFYPETDVTREIYESYRQKAAPVFCYVQGMESLSCLTWDTDRIVTLGVQTFPG